MCHFDRREKSCAFGMLDGKDFSLAQTGMTGADINAKAVAPGRAGRAATLERPAIMGMGMSP